MKVFVSCFAALALMATAGYAAPFDAKTISADAKWVVHVDVDAIRDSQIVKKAFATCPVLKSESGKHFDKIVEKFGIDLRKDLHGITLYGSDTEKDHAVAIVYAKVNQKLLLEKAEKAADHAVVKHGSIEIHTWTHKMGTKNHTGAGAFYKPNVIVFASTAKGVESVIEVLDGKSPGLTDPKSLLGGHVYKGSTLLARAIAIRPGTRCPVLKQAEGFRIAMGENSGKSFYRARLFMKTPEAATQIKTLTDGLKAIGDLKFSDNEQVKKIIDGLQATTKDKTVTVRWDASTEDVWNVVDMLAKKAMEHMKGHIKPTDGKKTSSTSSDGKCPFCNAAAEAAGKPTSSGECPAGCQCPACKAQAEAKAKADSKAK